MTGTPGPALAPATVRALNREWDLFTEWCQSWDLGPLPATTEIVARFLHDHPGAPSTRLQRIRAIRQHHEAAGIPLVMERTGPGPAALWRQDGRLDARAAMGQQPRYRFPVGIRGRRNAFLILLAGELGMTRTQIHAFGPDSIRLEDDLTTVGERLLAWEEDPRRCPACVARRWLQVVSVLLVGRDRLAARDLLDIQTATPDEHDCRKPVEPGWQQVSHLVTSVDRWGWVPTDPSVSTRTVTTIIGPLRVPTEAVEDLTYKKLDGGTFKHLTSAELAAKQDDVLNEVDALDLRIRQMLEHADDIDAILHGLGPG